MSPHNDHYALVIGINDYPGYSHLQGAIDDAKAFCSWLHDDQGGALPEANVRLILSNREPPRPIHDEIDDALVSIFKSLTPHKIYSRFYLFFSGHGLASDTHGANLCLAKWSRLRRREALDSSDYLNVIVDSGRFKEVVFFLDCCRIHLYKARGRPSAIEFPKPISPTTGTRTFIAFATEHRNPAYEAAMGQSEFFSQNGPHIRGYFTRALLAGLRGGAAQAPGGVTASKLKAHLEAEIPRIAKEHGHRQLPEVRNGLPANPESIFGHAYPQTHVKITFTNIRDGETTLEGPDLSIIRSGDASTGPWECYLPKGLYVLREKQTNELLPLRLSPEGGTIDVEF